VERTRPALGEREKDGRAFFCLVCLPPNAHARQHERAGPCPFWRVGTMPDDLVSPPRPGCPQRFAFICPRRGRPPRQPRQCAGAGQPTSKPAATATTTVTANTHFRSPGGQHDRHINQRCDCGESSCGRAAPLERPHTPVGAAHLDLLLPASPVRRAPATRGPGRGPGLDGRGCGHRPDHRPGRRNRG